MFANDFSDGSPKKRTHSSPRCLQLTWIAQLRSPFFSRCCDRLQKNRNWRSRKSWKTAIFWLVAILQHLKAGNEAPEMRCVFFLRQNADHWRSRYLVELRSSGEQKEVSLQRGTCIGVNLLVVLLLKNSLGDSFLG